LRRINNSWRINPPAVEKGSHHWPHGCRSIPEIKDGTDLVAEHTTHHSLLRTNHRRSRIDQYRVLVDANCMAEAALFGASTRIVPVRRRI
jgi:hypothetical protein